VATHMADALERGDLDAVGELVGEHWTHQRALHPTIPTAAIDRIIDTARREGALGAKAMGASGGGCVLVIARADDADRVRAAVGRLGEPLDFAVDTGGLTVMEPSA
jgi:D-glycero-alpha-D-manno-heptose-7-phosphate kinase